MLTTLSVACALGLFLYAAYSDCMTMRIPNWISIALIGAFALRWLGDEVSGFATVDPLRDVATGAAVFAAGFILFQMRMFGGGDIKLISAGALWFGFAHTLDFLFATALFGAAYSVIIIGLRFAGPVHVALQGWIPALQRTKQMPYAIAITSGALMALGLQLAQWGAY